MNRLNKIYIGTNTKMYKNIKETTDFIERLQDLTKDIPRDVIELFVLPSYIALDGVSKVANKKLIKYGSQNVSFEEKGQFTGEISPVMLQEAGATIAMIGHSERRNIFNETDEEENKKVKSVLNNNMTALLCIGEKEEEKEFGISDEVLVTQLKKCLYNISDKQAQKLIVAYEPVWAIGVNGKPASKEYASKRHIKIKKVLEEIFSADVAKEIPILYGGSVNKDNAKELIQMDGIDGLFIGRSAWEANSFNEIIRDVLKVKNLI